MQFRKIASYDYEEWKILWDGYLSFYKTSVDESVSIETFRRLISENEPMYGLLAENAGAIIGLVHFVFHRSTCTKGNYCYLQDLFVSPEARKQGVGRTLIEKVYDNANENGCSRVYWLTQENNYQARTVYDRVAERTDSIQYRKFFS
ncbi:GNAT family N-acetyltransferase [Erwinia tasmaniensis]|uniref:GNAT family N-acetyltransferase n=1 Tax=Erwinia tasmaniensis TaxID=338565 RepID=UPI003A4D78B8